MKKSLNNDDSAMEMSSSSKIDRSVSRGITSDSTAISATLVYSQSAHAVNIKEVIEKTAFLIYKLADGSIGDWFGGIMYSVGQQANEAIQIQLGALSFTSLVVIFGVDW